MVDMQITSPAFSDGSEIPRKYGYKNGNISPPLRISEIPENTESLILIVDDPDAKKAVGKVWTHWVVFNIVPYREMWSNDSNQGGTQVDPNTGTIEVVIPESKKGWSGCLTEKEWDQAAKHFAASFSSSGFEANRDRLVQNWQDHVGNVTVNGEELPRYGMLGLNDFGEFAYGGPAPPDAPHTYQFKVYALDEQVDRSLGMKGKQSHIESIMSDHIIAEAKLTGTYAH